MPVLRKLAIYFAARQPLVYMSTWEEERALAVIRTVVKDESLVRTPRTVFTWSMTAGLVKDGCYAEVDTQSALKALEFIERYGEPAVFVLCDIHLYFRWQGRSADPQVVRKLRDLASVLRQSPQPKNVVLVSPVLLLPPELQKDVATLDFELPSRSEIRTLLEAIIATNRQGGWLQADLEPSRIDQLAKAASGLTLQEAEQAFLRAMVEDRHLDTAEGIILDEKRQVVRKGEILEFLQPELQMEDVGGLGNLKRWLEKRDKAWDDAAQLYSLPAPKGILITGVPGCGKSLIAKAISAKWHMPLLRLDMGKVFAGLVGSSEENIRQAIKTAEGVAPAILWIDEIEKGLAGRGSTGDSGIATRVFGTLLTWMQEKEKPVFVVATANQIDYLPPELLRKGRFDEIFFVDLPTKSERMEIFGVHLRKRLIHQEVAGDLSISPELLGDLADRTEGFSGAEMEQVVIDALFEAYWEARSIRPGDLTGAIANTVPLSVTQAERIQAIREWASVRAVAATPKGT